MIEIDRNRLLVEVEGTHPEEFFLETVDLTMWLAYLSQEEVEVVHVVDGANAFVEWAHNRDGVLGQFFAASLFVACFQLLEFCEHVQQLLVLFK